MVFAWYSGFLQNLQLDSHEPNMAEKEVIIEISNSISNILIILINDDESIFNQLIAGY